jgi:hypothetical protein
MKTTVPQILEEVEKAKTSEDKVRVLQSYNTTCLRGLLNINFNPALNFGLPEGTPPFKNDPERPIGYSETNLYTEYRRLRIWLQPNDISKVRKEQLFIQMLEGIHSTEAELICLIKDRKLTHKYPSVQPELIRAAFPELLPEVLAEIPKLEKPKKEAKGNRAKKDSGVVSNPSSEAQLRDLEKRLLEQQLTTTGQ